MKLEEGYKPSAEEQRMLKALDEAAIVGFLGGVMMTLIFGAFLFSIR